ncbi:zinc-dependent alcohol dehydrogenase family protein [Alcanivorax sp. JB21]|uniref:zinc-dependent alcohol dehydrogenase family protein n=1 Tax=Alcanivorax limicola TaxID=2874102 RepID=UPI001CBE6011|nr:zinc-dependent alcohol dehydrogenase family protein [Alcanivorax limicola]MBZ2189457.1 zinc-dependent alcohol dehydrogenase family protein [Alcanivorax limicola]
MKLIKAQYDIRGPVPQDVIHPVVFERPQLGAGEVLLEVLAAPINPSDVLTLTGDYGMLPPLPAVGGNEGVGRVIELGPDVRHPAIGQVVLLPVGSGTWTTHMVAEAKALIPLPNDVDPKQLAMITVNPPTASLLLTDFVDLHAGDWVIQNAANSGVGSYLIQLAKVRGFRTINVVRRESAVEGVRQQGGDVVLVDGPDLRKRVRDLIGKGEVRLGIDAVAGAATDRLASCLAPGATLVNYGRMSGEPCQLSSMALIFNQIRLTGFWLAHWFRTTSQPEQMALFSDLTRLMSSGTLHAPIHATYGIEDIQAAVAAAAQGERHGKILIVPHGGA